MKSTRVPIWGPVLFSPSRENVAGSSDLPNLFLFYSRGATNTGCVGGTIEYVTSDDQGDTWSSPVIVHPFSGKHPGCALHPCHVANHYTLLLHSSNISVCINTTALTVRSGITQLSS